MNAAPLTVQLDYGPDGVRMELRGRIDREGDAALVDAYSQVTADGRTTPLILDFSGVDYINSTGIALIVRLLAEARRDSREVRGRGLSDHYREIFRITRLSDFIAIEDVVGSAAPGPEGASA
jgi:anti-sigma B factor antagonist